MAKTLKQILDTVCDEAGFDKPASYIGNTDPNIAQLVAMAHRSAIVLRELRLQKLSRHASISMDGGTDAFVTDGRIKSFPLPDDFYTLVPDTTYQSGRLDNAILPSTAPVWAYIIARMGIQTLPIRCRIIDNKLEVFSPMAGQTIEFEYISNSTVQLASQDPGSTTKIDYSDQFASDDDTWLLDTPLIELDVLWRYKRAKGIEGWQGDLEDSTVYQNSLRGRDAGARTIGYPKDWPYPNEPYTNLWVA